MTRRLLRWRSTSEFDATFTASRAAAVGSLGAAVIPEWDLGIAVTNC